MMEARLAEAEATRTSGTFASEVVMRHQLAEGQEVQPNLAPLSRGRSIGIDPLSLHPTLVVSILRSCQAQVHVWRRAAGLRMSLLMTLTPLPQSRSVPLRSSIPDSWRDLTHRNRQQLQQGVEEEKSSIERLAQVDAHRACRLHISEQKRAARKLYT